MNVNTRTTTNKVKQMKVDMEKQKFWVVDIKKEIGHPHKPSVGGVGYQLCKEIACRVEARTKKEAIFKAFVIIIGSEKLLSGNEKALSDYTTQADIKAFVESINNEDEYPTLSFVDAAYVVLSVE